MAKRQKRSNLFQPSEKAEAADMHIPASILQPTAPAADESADESVDTDVSKADLEAANSQLFQEKSDLTEKLADCIAEIESLKESIKCKDDEIAQLKSQYKVLQDEYDKVLLTVSQLSYENSQLKQSSIAAEQAHGQETTQMPQQYAKNVSYKQNQPKRVKLIPTNGYDSWN